MTAADARKRVSGVSQVLAADDAHHRCKRPEDPFRSHLEFVVHAREVSLRREKEPVPALDPLDTGNDAHAFWPREFLQLLDNLAEAAQIPLKARPVADFAGVEPTRGTDG